MMTHTRDPHAVAVRTVDLSQPLQALTDVFDYAGVRLFVTWGDRPLGSVDIANRHQPISQTRLRECIAAKLTVKLLQEGLIQHFAPASLVSSATRPAALPATIPVSVVVATYDRPDDLRNCLHCLVNQVSPRSVEIIVVDNHPASGLTAAVVAEFHGVVLVHEPRKGLAYARNAGFSASRGDVVIATDDDVTMPLDWLEKLVAPFVNPDVMAATGNVLPLELETAAQRLFEAYGRLGCGYERMVVDGGWFQQFRSAVPTWKLGVMANAAFRATILSHPRIGLLDESLGRGAPAGCGEDAYLFYKILKAGYTLVYEPAAYVWHKHGRDFADLRRRVYNYGKGHVAYHLTTLMRDQDLRAWVRLGIRLPQTYIRRMKDRLGGRSEYPLALILIEMAGNLAGPWALWRSRRIVKREGRSMPYVPVAQRSDPEQRTPGAEMQQSVTAGGADGGGALGAMPHTPAQPVADGPGLNASVS
jgi:glycosyltransferase involved in cell wall biosynthesis